MTVSATNTVIDGRASLCMSEETAGLSTTACAAVQLLTVHRTTGSRRLLSAFVKIATDQARRRSAGERSNSGGRSQQLRCRDVGGDWRAVECCEGLVMTGGTVKRPWSCSDLWLAD